MLFSIRIVSLFQAQQEGSARLAGWWTVEQWGQGNVPFEPLMKTLIPVNQENCP